MVNSCRPKQLFEGARARPVHPTLIEKKNSLVI